MKEENRQISIVESDNENNFDIQMMINGQY